MEGGWRHNKVTVKVCSTTSSLWLLLRRHNDPVSTPFSYSLRDDALYPQLRVGLLCTVMLKFNIDSGIFLAILLMYVHTT